jgi:hypothetical protein
MKSSRRFLQFSVLALILLIVLGCSLVSNVATPTPEATASLEVELPETATATEVVEATPEAIHYTTDLNSNESWNSHTHLKVSGGELEFSPTAFEQVWAKDFSETLGDFSLLATLSYDTAGIDGYGVAIVIGDPITNNFFLLGPNPYQGDTIWFFVMVKDGEHIHPDVSPPTTTGQPEEFTIEIRRAGDKVSAYVDGQKIMTRDDIVFEGQPAKMSVGVHADGNNDTIYLHELTVSEPGSVVAASTPDTGSVPEPAATGTGSFTGRLLDHSSQDPVAGAGIVLCLDTGDSCTIDATLSAQTGSGGEFEIADIPSGKYVIFYNFNGINTEFVDEMVVEVNSGSADCLGSGFAGSVPAECEGSIPFADDPKLMLKGDSRIEITETAFSVIEGSVYSQKYDLHLDFNDSKPLTMEFGSGDTVNYDLLIWGE